MISALADAGAVLERARLPRGRRADCADFVLGDLRDERGPPAAHLQGRPGASCTPTSRTTRSCSRRCSTLYEATFEPRWFAEARAAGRHDDRALRRRARTAASSRPRPMTSSSSRGARTSRTTRSPPATRRAAYGLLRLAALTGEHDVRGAGVSACCGSCTSSRRATRTRSPTCSRRSTSTSRPSREVALVGDDRGPLERVVRGAFRPHLVLAGGEAATACRCSRAASPSTAAPPPTCASASPARRP